MNSLNIKRLHLMTPEYQSFVLFNSTLFPLSIHGTNITSEALRWCVETEADSFFSLSLRSLNQ